jgi:hypothetical protein
MDRFTSFQVNVIDREGDFVVDELGGSDGLLDPNSSESAAQFGRIDDPAQASAIRTVTFPVSTSGSACPPARPVATRM